MKSGQIYRFSKDLISVIKVFKEPKYIREMDERPAS
jgi:hypothetical protein